MELGIVFLGTGATVPTPWRGLPSVAVCRRGRCIILDAGEGTQRSMTLYGLSPLRVEAVFITHLHGDHVLGLPGLLQSMGMAGRREPLLVAGPPGLRGFLEEASKATMWLPGFPVVVWELQPGDRVELPRTGLRVEAHPVDHTVPALGYRVEEPPPPPRVDLEAARRLGVAEPRLLARLRRGEPVYSPSLGRRVEPREVLQARRPVSIFYTGDTRACSCVARAARGVDVLIHDSTFTSDMEEEAAEQGHSTARQAAEVAEEAEARLLVLFHISARYRSPRPLLEEARPVHPETVAAVDGARLPLRL